jgi:hypothetical protein
MTIWRIKAHRDLLMSEVGARGKLKLKGDMLRIETQIIRPEKAMRA